MLKASGLKYTMHSAGTTVEGSWDEVMKVVGQAHAVVHQGGVKRVQSSMRVGTRYVLSVLLTFSFFLCSRFGISPLIVRALLLMLTLYLAPFCFCSKTEPTRNKQLKTR